jgi:hypothetical protein
MDDAFWNRTSADDATVGQRTGMALDRMRLTEERQQIQEEEGDVGRTRRPKKRLTRWRQVMELPGSGSDAEKLWRFVAAHVEDGRRKKACPLAVKAWQEVCKQEKVGYGERRDVDVLPSVMPLFRRKKTGAVTANWTDK